MKKQKIRLAALLTASLAAPLTVWPQDAPKPTDTPVPAQPQSAERVPQDAPKTEGISGEDASRARAERRSRRDKRDKSRRRADGAESTPGGVEDRRLPDREQDATRLDNPDATATDNAPAGER